MTAYRARFGSLVDRTIVRVGAAFGTIVVLLLMVIGLGITRMAVLNEHLHSITDENNVESALAVNVHTVAYDMGVSVRDIIIFTDPETLRAKHTELEEDFQHLDDTADKLGKMFTELPSTTTNGEAVASATQTYKSGRATLLLLGAIAVALAVRATVAAMKQIAQMVPNIKKTSDLVQEISAASQEQSSGVGQINAAVTQLSQTTQGNASSSEELAATAEEMANQAEQPQQTMSFFKITGSAAKRTTRRPATATARPSQPAAAKKIVTAEPDESQFVKFA